MATGLKIYNDANTVQIDESYRNLCFVRKDAYYISHGLGFAYVDITAVGPRACMCIESANYVPVLANLTFDGTQWIYRWGFYYLGGSYPVGDFIYAWIFDYLTSPPADTVGLKVWNASNEMVFHSAAKPLRIVATETHNNGYTGTGGRKYLPLVMQGAFYRVGSTNYSIGLQSSGNVITPQAAILSTGLGPAGTLYGQYAIVDVTHY